MTSPGPITLDQRFTGGGTLIAIVVGLWLGRSGGEVASVRDATAIPDAGD